MADAFDEEIELVQGRHRSRSISQAYLRRPADAGVLRLGHQQFRRARSCWRPSPRTRPAPLPRDARERAGRAAGGGAHRLRVQDPGQHGPGAPRPHRVPARCARAATRAACGCIHVRLGKEVRVADALTFMAADREQRRGGLSPATSSACTTTARSTSATPSPRARRSHFTGIPNFAPEMFRRARAARIR